MRLKITPKIDELREECSSKGLPTTGSLRELRERIKIYDAKEKSDLFRAITAGYGAQAVSVSSADNRFFVQMKLENVFMYFIHGYLYPLNLETSAIYKEQNRKPDLLTQFANYIPLSKGVVEDFDETQTLIEVILTDEEINNLLHIDDLYFVNGPLPISRISALYFANNSVRTSFFASVDIFPDAYMPKDLCLIIPEKIKTVKSMNRQPSSSQLTGWQDTLALYDRLLGMIAFLKNTALFYTNKSGEYLDYAPSYFQVLGNINNCEGIPQKDNSFFKWILGPDTIELEGKVARFQFREILKAVYANIEFDIDWGIHLLENSVAFEQNKENIDQLREIIKVLFDYKKLRIDYRTVLSHSLVQKNIPIIILIFLIKFSNKGMGHSDKQAVKNYFKSNECAIDRGVAEYIFATLGLYYGYNNMVKEDRFELSDPYFNSLARENGQIKFKLDSFLDRFTIESVFQFSRKNREQLKDRLDFLKVVTNSVPSKQQPPHSFEVEYVDQSYVKFEKRITDLRRIGANAVLAKEILRLYDSHITQKEHLFTYVSKHLPELLTIDRDKLAAIIAENPTNRTLQELRDTIELDKKYGRNSFRR